MRDGTGTRTGQQDTDASGVQSGPRAKRALQCPFCCPFSPPLVSQSPVCALGARYSGQQQPARRLPKSLSRSSLALLVLKCCFTYSSAATPNLPVNQSIHQSTNLLLWFVSVTHWPTDRPTDQSVPRPARIQCPSNGAWFFIPSTIAAATGHACPSTS